MAPNDTAASRYPLCAAPSAAQAPPSTRPGKATAPLPWRSKRPSKKKAKLGRAWPRTDEKVSSRPGCRNTSVDGTGDILRPIRAAWNPPEELRQIRAIATGKKATTSRIDGHDRLGPSKTEIALSGRVNDREPLRRSAAAASLPGSSELHRKTHRCMRASIRTRPPAGSPLPGLR